MHETTYVALAMAKHMQARPSVQLAIKCMITRTTRQEISTARNNEIYRKSPTM